MTTRPLTADEIIEKGIVVDEENFQVLNFTAAFGVEDKKVTIDFPVLVPNPGVDLPAVRPPALPALSPASFEPPGIKLQALALEMPNVSVAGFVLDCVDLSVCDPENRDLIPPSRA